MQLFRTLRNIPLVFLFQTLNDDDEQAEWNCELSSDANKLHALRYLLILLLLQVLLQPGEFSDAASELIICCKKVILHSYGEDDLDDDTAPELTDSHQPPYRLLFSRCETMTCSKSSMSCFPYLCSSFALRVFRCFCGDVTDDGLLRILWIIEKDLNAARHQQDEDELLGAEKDENVGEAEMNDGESEDSEAVVGDDVADKELPEDSDDSDEGMDDEAMFRMDTYLAEIFKPKKDKAGGETVIYRLHAAKANEQLVQRIWGILQRYSKEKKVPADQSVQLSTLESLLENNLKFASKPFKIKKSTVVYFDNKRSPIKSGFLKEIFRRHPRIFPSTLRLTIEEMRLCKIRLLRVEALDLVIKALKSQSIEEN
ncbi:myb-binding protein 1A [Gossypium australe]|uniref:Myb-binding protein 1A n=1 Tax=Gossypium australe TaxID=47621 RepID=A0A5B6WN75_9ROSI|nr:myb-binding protein 1A [Gossypium australe]